MPTKKVIIVAVICWGVCLAVTYYLSDYWLLVSTTNDNRRYLDVTERLLSWDFVGYQPEVFWGLPIILTVLTAITQLDPASCLVLLNLLCYAATVLLLFRLYGEQVALWFPILTMDFIQGAEHPSESVAARASECTQPISATAAMQRSNRRRTPFKRYTSMKLGSSKTRTSPLFKAWIIRWVACWCRRINNSRPTYAMCTTIPVFVWRT